MKRYIKMGLSAFLSITMLISSVAFTPFEAMAAVTIAGGGWYESIFAELTGTSDSAVTAVSWTGTNGSGSLTGEDLQYLVRDTNGKVRIDIPGVKPGTYTLTVTAGGADYKKENIEVYAYDRSGYAHWNRTDFTSEGVGAYKDDGTLKANAKVLYVTNSTKDTVTVSSSDGTTVTGIGNILNSAGGNPKKDDKGNVVSTVVNTNQDIILKLAQDNTPLVVRIIGDVQAPQGLTAYDSDDYGGTVGDNGYMARMQSGKNVTIEGIGPDATINGWGLHYICQSSHPELGKSFEVRNLAFRNVPEDCVGMEGQQSGNAITAGVERCWIHHCEFYHPTIANPAEGDKDGGDGACDFKRGQFLTNSYCIYDGYHKTNLVGSSDSSLQYNLTYHHNYWRNCESRGPLGRQANIHMYNNYVEGQTSYAQQTRANCYIFSEYNLFYQCKNPQQVKGGGPIKSYKDSLSGCIDAMDATVVNDKSQVVSSSNKFSAFDTNPSLSYIPSGDYLLDESIATVKAKALSQAGVMKADPIMDPEDVNTSMVQSDRQPTGSVPLPYDKALNSTYVTSKNMTVDNIIFNVSKTDSSCLTVGGNEVGQDIVFNVNTAVDISITDGGGSYPVILMNDSGEEIIIGTGTASNVPAGTYFIQSSGFQPAKGSSPAKFKESKITHLKITPFDANAPTVAEPTTQATTQAKESSSQTTTKSSTAPKPEPGPETTTNAQSSQPGGGTDADNTFHSFTADGQSDPEEFFSFEGSTSDTKGSATYKGVQYTVCLKMDSKSDIVFTSDEGKVIIVDKDGTGIKLDGTEILYSSMTKIAGETYAYEFPVTAGIHSITKGGSGESHIYYIEYIPDKPIANPEPEAGTAVLSVESQTVTKGQVVSVPVKISGITALSDYAITLNYTPGALTYVSPKNGTACPDSVVKGSVVRDGLIKVTGTNSSKTISDGYLFYVNFTANSTTDITIAVETLKSDANTDIKSSTTGGTVTVNAKEAIPLDGFTSRGDAVEDGIIDDYDAYAVLKYISGIDTGLITNMPNAAYAAEGKYSGKLVTDPDMADVVYILLNKGNKPDTPESSESTTKENVTETTTSQAPAKRTSFDWLPTGDISNGAEIYSTSKVKITACQNLYLDSDSSKTDLPSDIGGLPIKDYVKTKNGEMKLGGTTYRVAAQIEALDDVTVTFGICMYANKTYTFIDKSTEKQINPVKQNALSYGTISVTLKKGDVVYYGGAGTNPEIYGINVDPANGSVEEPKTEATTKASVTTTKATEPTTKPTTQKDTTTETTTLAPSGPNPQLSPVPSNIAGSVTSDSLSDFKNGIAALNKNGGTLQLDTPRLSLIGDTIKLSGNKEAAIVGVKQPDGTYPVLDCSKLNSGKRGLTISGSNIIVQNIIVEGAPDNGIIIDGGTNNTLEHVIARYNGDTGIQLSNDATDNVLRYCYSYRNVDIGTYGANADGFAPKLGAKNTTFEYCYSWDNSDDGWDSYDKTGDNTPIVEYRHSACWNNGNPDVFTGKYDYDNGDPLDKKLTTVQQMMSSDSSYETNYNNKKFDTSKAKINGESVANWVNAGAEQMNGNGFKFGSKETLTNGSVIRSAYYCLAFDHKAKNFDNNNSQNCTAYFSNCIAFGSKTKPNYQIPYNFKLWENVYGWNGASSDVTNGKTVVKPSNTAELETEINRIKDQIIDYCYANKFPDGITFDDVFTMIK